MSAAKAVHRLIDIVVEEVSLVDRAANKHRFLIVKRDEGEGVDEPMEDLTQDVDDDENPPGDGDGNGGGGGAGEGSEDPNAGGEGEPTPTLEVAVQALTSLTDAVERLSSAEGAAPEEIGKVVVELNAAAQQLAKTAGATSPSAASSQSAPPSASTEEPLAQVRAALAQVREMIATSAKPAEPTASPAPTPASKSEGAPAAGGEKLDALLEQVSALAKGLKDQRQQLGQRLGQLEKHVGLPNSSSAGERPPKRRDEDEFWSLDLNQPLDRDSVDKSVSFHDV